MSTQTANLQEPDVMAYLRPSEHARLIGPTESIPAGLEAGFEQLGRLDRDWVWVLESDGKIKGVLIACPCHGCAFIWRLSVDPKISKVSVLRLLRRFYGDLRKRGLVGHMTIIDPSTATQRHLVRMLEKVGAVKVRDVQLFAGPLPEDGL